MPGPTPESDDGLRDDVPPFPPHRAYPHLTEIEYHVLKTEYERKQRQEGPRDGKNERRPAG